LAFWPQATAERVRARAAKEIEFLPNNITTASTFTASVPDPDPEVHIGAQARAEFSTAAVITNLTILIY
jgi:hypothetical protein